MELVLLGIVVVVATGYQMWSRSEAAEPISVERRDDPVDNAEWLHARLSKRGFAPKGEWVQDGFCWKRGYRMQRGIRQPWELRVRADGSSCVVAFVPLSHVQSTVFWVIPAGPKIPVGGDEFLALRKHLGRD